MKVIYCIIIEMTSSVLKLAFRSFLIIFILSTQTAVNCQAPAGLTSTMGNTKTNSGLSLENQGSSQMFSRNCAPPPLHRNTVGKPVIVVGKPVLVIGKPVIGKNGGSHKQTKKTISKNKGRQQKNKNKKKKADRGKKGTQRLLQKVTTITKPNKEK